MRRRPRLSAPPTGSHDGQLQACGVRGGVRRGVGGGRRRGPRRLRREVLRPEPERNGKLSPEHRRRGDRYSAGGDAHGRRLGHRPRRSAGP